MALHFDRRWKVWVIRAWDFGIGSGLSRYIVLEAAAVLC